jgi:DNA processing protein
MQGDTERIEQILSIAVGLLRQTERYQCVAQVREAGSFSIVKDHVPAAQMHRAAAILERCGFLGIEIWPLTSLRYPQLLRHIDDPPSGLYVRHNGKVSSISEAALAVVGKRSATVESCLLSTEIAKELAASGVCIVSGLALGIDAAAHRGALQSARASSNVPCSTVPCSTVAVLAHGLDRVYPPTHAGLAQQILEAGGALISEYPPGVEAMRHHFLARNRIIAGLSRGVVVIQAGAKSGSLVTARCAADYGRDVFVLQDVNRRDDEAGGTGLLEQGAIGISSARDVLREYRLLQSAAELPGSEGAQWREFPLEHFIKSRGWSLEQLLRHELQGTVERLPGNRLRVLEFNQR